MSDNHRLHATCSQPIGDVELARSHEVVCSPMIGDVEHTHHLSEHIGALYLNDEYSDVTLIVEDRAFKGHKVILAARSDYFRALLYGGMRESQLGEIELKGTSLQPFEKLLKYIYTGKMKLSDLKEDVLLEVLGLSHQYGFVELEAAISDYLKAILSVRNICSIYDLASLYHLTNLLQVCSLFADCHALEILQVDNFLNLSAGALKSLLQRDSFCAPEVEIFRGACEWVKANPEVEDPSEILGCVRLHLLSLTELLDVVRPTGFIGPDAILDAIKFRNQSKDTELQYRGYLMPEENIATPSHRAQVLHGEMKSALLDGDIINYDMERGFTRHPIDEDRGQGILVKLGMQAIINHMKLLLWNKDMRSYSYYIEVSIDQKDWVRVVDHSKYLCRSWQYLYFPARVVRYVRIVGTHNTVNRVFHAVSFECMYTNRPFTLDNGLLVPTQNVASIEAHACVIEGVSRSRNTLLNGNTHNYDWDTGYTCHQLGSGAIIIQLSQPFVVGSCRLLLWDCDDRSYSYYIETSNDQLTWEMAVDKTRESCKSWQMLKFRPRPVSFIRIVGTQNTANEVFHCVHFECPIQVPVLSVDSSESSAVLSAGSSQQPLASTEDEQIPPEGSPNRDTGRNVE